MLIKSDVKNTEVLIKVTERELVLRRYSIATQKIIHTGQVLRVNSGSIGTVGKQTKWDRAKAQGRRDEGSVIMDKNLVVTR